MSRLQSTPNNSAKFSRLPHGGLTFTISMGKCEDAVTAFSQGTTTGRPSASPGVRSQIAAV